MLKEGDVAYNQQCDTILKPENLQLQGLSVILEDKTLLQCIHEDLVHDFLIVAIINHWKNPSNDFNKFESHDGLLYHDRLLYVLEGFVRLQVLQTRHDTLVVGHFGFNKTTELVSRDYWWS